MASLMTNEPFPRMLLVQQIFSPSPQLDLRRTLITEFARIRPQLRPGMRIALAVGSRGIANLRAIVRTLIEQLLASGVKPFIVPAMGSHGGATANGQIEILAAYGISEETLKVPVKAGMEVECLGTDAHGGEVLFSGEALRSDAILLVNRVKPHTDFVSDKLGSGLMKMLVVGLGKHRGAARFHAVSTSLGEENYIRAQAQVVLRTAHMLGGLAIVEDQHHQTTHLEFLSADQLEAGEARLFAAAKRQMAALPFDDIDLLIVDRIGKNISGTGMDPTVIGRSVHGYSAQLRPAGSARPHVRRLFVRDLTPESHGNANGIGMADFTTDRLVRAFDLQTTYRNVLTSLSLQNAKIPMHFATDREVVTHALSTLALPDSRLARVMRIADTSSLEFVAVSEAYADLVGANPKLKALTSPTAMCFEKDGNLPPLS